VAVVLLTARDAPLRQRLRAAIPATPARADAASAAGRGLGFEPGPRRNVVLVSGLAGTAVVAGRIPVGVPAALLVGAVIGRRVRISRRAVVARDAAARAVIEVTVGLAAELRSGRTPAQALAAVVPWSGPLRPALSVAAGTAATGGSVADGLILAAGVPGAEPLRQVAAVWRATESVGGRLAAVLDRLADSLDAELSVQLELDSALAGPRATVVLLAGLPLMGLALGQAVGADPLHLLLHRPLGWGLLTGAGLLDGAGLVVMSMITRWATRW
jgi:tight adherence protein B